MMTQVPVTLWRGDLTRIAERAGRRKQHVQAVLRGERKPSRELAEQIAAYFSETRGEPVTVAELFPEVGPRAASTEEEEESQHSGEGRNSQDAQIERTG